jgi:hypothetical protein
VLNPCAYEVPASHQLLLMQPVYFQVVGWSCPIIPSVASDSALARVLYLIRGKQPYSPNITGP